MVDCHPPSCMRRLSWVMWRTVAIISPHASSGVAFTTAWKAGAPKFECETMTPWSVAASMSRLGRVMPMMVISRSLGRRSIRVRGSAMRSRTVTRTSKFFSASAASSSERCRSNTVISALLWTGDQSATSRAARA